MDDKRCKVRSTASKSYCYCLNPRLSHMFDMFEVGHQVADDGHLTRPYQDTLSRSQILCRGLLYRVLCYSVVLLFPGASLSGHSPHRYVFLVSTEIHRGRDVRKTFPSPLVPHPCPCRTPLLATPKIKLNQPPAHLDLDAATFQTRPPCHLMANPWPGAQHNPLRYSLVPCR